MRSHSDKTGKRDSLQERRAVMVQPRLTTWVEEEVFLLPLSDCQGLIVLWF